MRKAIRSTTLLLLALLSSCFLPMACGNGGGEASTDGDADTDADGDTDADSDTDTDTDTGDECVPGDEQPWLLPADIGFVEASAPFDGSFVYYSVWGQAADSLEMITPDGATEATRFTVHRLWSFGVAADGETIAFSSADPYQEQHFCLTIGDAIQHTWLWQAGQDPVQITTGRVNDECHLFGPDGEALYMCRRAGFWQEMTADGFQFGSDPYRILVHDITGGEESWLTPPDPVISDIGPALRDDGSLLFWRQEPQGTGFAQWLMSMNGDGTDISYLVESGTNPVTNPAGTEVLFRQSWKSIRLGDSHAPGEAEELVAAGDGNVFDYAFSPEQDRVAFTRGRLDASCSDLWVVDVASKSETRIVDCLSTGRFITGIAWVDRK